MSGTRIGACCLHRIGYTQKVFVCSVLDETGEIKEETRIANTKESLEQFASKYIGAKAVIEATSNYRYIYDIFEKYMEVKLAHPYKTRTIAEARIKNDRLDAKMLAHLLRANLIAESYVPPKEVRELRDLTRARKALIEDRNRLKNRVHTILSRNGIIEYPNPFTKKGREFLESVDLSEIDREPLNTYLSIIDRINSAATKS